MTKNGDGSFTQTGPDGLLLQYDTNGRMSRLQSAAGGRWTAAYDAGTARRDESPRR